MARKNLPFSHPRTKYAIAYRAHRVLGGLYQQPDIYAVNRSKRFLESLPEKFVQAAMASYSDRLEFGVNKLVLICDRYVRVDGYEFRKGPRK